MKKGFSIINILIIIGLLALVYLGYNKYVKNDKEVGLDQGINMSTSTSGTIEQVRPPEDGSTIKSVPELTELVVDQSSSKKEEIVQPVQSEPAPPAESEEPMTQNGFYQNATYNYEITCPADWPLKIRSEDNISIGTVPPKNGQGAINIKVSSHGSNEVQQAKNEAKKYPGVIAVAEETIVLSGVTGSKLIISNLLNKITNIYIILERNGWHYAIKYSEESANFVSQVEAALATFKFTK